MSMRGGGGRGGGGRVSGGDIAAQKAANAEAPKIPDLLPRIGQLFAPYRAQLIVTIVLVLVERRAERRAAPADPAGVRPRAASRRAGSLPDVPVLVELVGVMVRLWVASAALGVWQTYLTARVGNSVMGALRIRLFSHLQAMELGFFTTTKTGVIQSPAAERCRRRRRAC